MRGSDGSQRSRGRKRGAGIVAAVVATFLMSTWSAYGQGEDAPAVSDETLSSLTLKEAVDIALTRSETTKIAASEIERADALIMEYRSSAWPHLTGVAGYKYNIYEPTQKIDFSGFNPLMEAMDLPPMEDAEIPLVYKHDWSFTLSATQNLYTFGRLGSAVKLARQTKQMSEDQAELTGQDVVLEVTEAYYSVVLGKELAAVARQNLQITQMHADDAQKKFDAGLKSEYELMQTKTAVAEARTHVISTETQYEVAGKNLLRTIGLSLDRKVEPSDSFVAAAAVSDLDALLSEARQNRIELSLLGRQREMSVTKSSLYVSNMLPILAANMDYTYMGRSETDEDRLWPVEDDWKTYWSVGVSLTWPIFDGLENYGRYRQTRVEERIARLDRARAEKGIELAVTRLSREVDSLALQLQVREEAEQLAKRAFELASIRFDAGLGTLLERADARAMWTQARVRLLQTQYEMSVARARLDRATGQGWD